MNFFGLLENFKRISCFLRLLEKLVKSFFLFILCGLRSIRKILWFLIKFLKVVNNFKIFLFWVRCLIKSRVFEVFLIFREVFREIFLFKLYCEVVKCFRLILVSDFLLIIEILLLFVILLLMMNLCCEILFV